MTRKCNIISGNVPPPKLPIVGSQKFSEITCAAEPPADIDNFGKFWVTDSLQELVTAFHADPVEQENRAWLKCTDFPETVQINCRFHPFCDGGGLCSPGRWRPGNRGPRKLSKVRI